MREQYDLGLDVIHYADPGSLEVHDWARKFAVAEIEGVPKYTNSTIGLIDFVIISRPALQHRPVWNMLNTQIALCARWDQIVTHLKHMLVMHPEISGYVEMSGHTQRKICDSCHSHKLRRVVSIAIMKELGLFQNNIKLIRDIRIPNILRRYAPGSFNDFVFLAGKKKKTGILKPQDVLDETFHKRLLGTEPFLPQRPLH